MSYRLVALDLDGTLLDDEKNISVRNRSAIQAAQDNQVIVTLSTGRMYSSAVRFAEELEMDVPFISYDGALVKDASGRVYRDLPLTVEAAMAALDVAEKHDIHVNLFIHDQLHVDRDDIWTQRYRRFTPNAVKEVSDLKTVLDHGPNKVVLVAQEEELAQVRPVLEKELAGRAHITTAHPRFLEIVHPDVSKRSGLEYLIGEFGLTRGQTIAIGDNYNDLEIIKFAGLGVAMANAPAPVRDLADYVTLSNGEDGVAAVIEKFILATM